VTRGPRITTVVLGAFGKPRPSLMVQAKRVSAHSSVTLLPLTSSLGAAAVATEFKSLCLEEMT